MAPGQRKTSEVSAPVERERVGANKLDSYAPRFELAFSMHQTLSDQPRREQEMRKSRSDSRLFARSSSRISVSAPASAATATKPPKEEDVSVIEVSKQPDKPGALSSLPYAASVVSSVGSAWRNQYAEEMGQGELLKRKLISQDIRLGNETSAGVCVMRSQKLPPAPKESDSAKVSAALIRNAENALKMAEQEISEHQATRTQYGKNVKEEAGKGRDPKQGGSHEFLPLQQARTAGKPAICRPMVGAYKEFPKIHEDDSLFTSTSRSDFWWKDLPKRQHREMKRYTRPFDEKSRFRESMIQMRGSMRFPCFGF